MGIQIGPIETRNRVFLAPMSGVTDQPFRQIAHECGAGLVVTEMVASAELVHQRADMLRRARGGDRIRPFVVQLAGREAKWMDMGARLAVDLGADIIDINMGCPARVVTGGLSGSSLMRDPAHALTLIEATVKAVSVPVTLKMRLGWDDRTINAPQIARDAASAGIRLITVHGRTRCQFYKGRADWAAIRQVRDRISVPLIANGDFESLDDVREGLRLSGADGVMIGRGAYGRPWWPAVIANGLDAGSGNAAPSLASEAEIVRAHHAAILSFYGNEHGNRIARKHLRWFIDRLVGRKLLTDGDAHQWRARLLNCADNTMVSATIAALYGAVSEREAA